MSRDEIDKWIDDLEREWAREDAMRTRAFRGLMICMPVAAALYVALIWLIAG